MRMTIVEFANKHGLNPKKEATIAHGVMKFLVKKGFAKKVDMTPKQGQGRPSAIYEIDETITIKT